MKEQKDREIEKLHRSLDDFEKPGAAQLSGNGPAGDIREKYTYLIQTVPCAIYSALPYESGTTVFMSDRWTKWTGYSVEDFCRDSDTWPKSIHPEDREKTIKAYIDAYKAGKEFLSEYRVVHWATGEIHYIRDQGVPRQE